LPRKVAVTSPVWLDEEGHLGIPLHSRTAVVREERGGPSTRVSSGKSNNRVINQGNQDPTSTATPVLNHGLIQNNKTSGQGSAQQEPVEKLMMTAISSINTEARISAGSPCNVTTTISTTTPIKTIHASGSITTTSSPIVKGSSVGSLHSSSTSSSPTNSLLRHPLVSSSHSLNKTNGSHHNKNSSSNNTSHFPSESPTQSKRNGPGPSGGVVIYYSPPVSVVDPHPAVVTTVSGTGTPVSIGNN